MFYFTCSNQKLKSMTDDTVTIFLPNWLNSEFLAKHLQSYYNDKTITLTNFEVKPATVKGDNYCSSMFRVTIYFTSTQSTADNVKIVTEVSLSCAMCIISI